MSSKIKILDQTLTELATLNAVSSASRFERINADNTLNFSFPIRKVESALINENSVFELDGDLFDIAFFKKEQQSDGKLMVTIEAEHVSYRLNNPEYNVDFFTEMGTPEEILEAILDGTEFEVGTVEFEEEITFSIQESMSRRGLLMQFVAYLGGEVEFDGFEISILVQRGSSTPKVLRVGKDVTVMSKSVDKRSRDNNGNPIVLYTCGVYKGAAINLGDVVTLDYDKLDINNVQLRVVSKTYDPYNPDNVAIEIGNYVNALEDDLYRIETTTVAKDARYNGCRIGPEFGFEAVLSDGSARAFFNSTALKMQKSDGNGGWVDALYFDPVTGKYKFVGDIVMEGGTISWENIDPDTIPEDIGMSEEQVTVIARNEIRTAKIRVDNLTANDVENPIIELFEPGSIGADGAPTNGAPAIDATYQMNQGIGHAIRFKWNNENYILYTTNGATFYFQDKNNDNRPHVRPDGFYVGSKKIGTPASSIKITYRPDGSGFDTRIDGIDDTWGWEKDGSGRITKLTSASGRTVIVEF